MTTDKFHDGRNTPVLLELWQRIKPEYKQGARDLKPAYNQMLRAQNQQYTRDISVLCNLADKRSNQKKSPEIKHTKSILTQS